MSEVFPVRVSVLGVQYALEYRTKANDKGLETCDGYCDTSVKLCVVRKYTAAERREPLSLKDMDAYMRKCMRHELTHAFLYESGLSVNGMSPESWPTNEEMVDWMAIQGPKLYDAWKRAGCL